ncbi:hypothetical protein NEOLEDRAFT_1151153 [Neolentinus lepideus HHB14362 ss-1]|uniref:DUF6534 domain-containing protein n=1 Tax=Neolentinus lepideus HHB14362 ss-1 TaxID=1314782 RepID=A0A165P8L5_9AGAM|nr:hypothetical protein NEOLEDRAFT_1151153 [Neolentinus lepideus HHB14362 ss-1]
MTRYSDALAFPTERASTSGRPYVYLGPASRAKALIGDHEQLQAHNWTDDLGCLPQPHDTHEHNYLVWSRSHIELRLDLRLYGISVLQVYFYYMTYPEDRRLVKLYVGVLFLMDSACVGLITHAIYVMLVNDWGNLLGLLTFPKTFMCILTFIVQCWFAQRVYLVSKWHYRLVPPSLIVIPAIVSLGTTDFNAEDSMFTKICVMIEHGSATVSDVIITGTLCAALYTRRSHETICIRSTRAQLNVLVAYAINRGALTYISLTNNANWTLWHLMLGKVYVNSTLAMLNARQYLRKYRLNGVNIVEVSGMHPDTSLSLDHNLLPIPPQLQPKTVRDSNGDGTEVELKTFTYAP